MAKPKRLPPKKIPVKRPPPPPKKKAAPRRSWDSKSKWESDDLGSQYT